MLDETAVFSVTATWGGVADVKSEFLPVPAAGARWTYSEETMVFMVGNHVVDYGDLPQMDPSMVEAETLALLAESDFVSAFDEL